MPNYANVLIKVVAILGVINRVSAAIPEHNVLVTPQLRISKSIGKFLSFGPKSGFKNYCRARAGFELVISRSGRVKASN